VFSLERDSTFRQELWSKCRVIADDCFVSARYEELVLRKFRVEELNVAESDQFEWVIIPRRYAGHRYSLAGIDDPFAGLRLRFGQRRMLEAGQEIIIKLTFQTTVTRAARIQNDEISV